MTTRFRFLPLAQFCDDVAFNQGFVGHGVGKIVCVSSYDIPVVPRKLRTILPRYLVEPDELDANGRWIVVVVDFEYVLRIHVQSFEHLRMFIETLCIGCFHPYVFCHCDDKPANLIVDWEILDHCGIEIVDTRQLNRATTGRTSYVQVFTPVSRARWDLLSGTPTDALRRIAWEPTQLQARWDEVPRNFIPHMRAGFNKLGRDLNKRFESKTCSCGEVTVQSDYDQFLKTIEDISTCFYQLRRARDVSDITLAFLAFVRSVTGKPAGVALGDLAQSLTDSLKSYFVYQSESSEWTETLLDMYENYSKCKNTLLVKKLKRVFNHLIAHTVYHKLGIEVDSKIFARLEDKVIRPTLADCATFLDAVVSLLVFLFKQGRQAMVLGSYEPFFMSGDSVGDWMDRVKKLKMKEEFLGNPEPAGFDIFSYLRDLDAAISDGNSIGRFSCEDGFDYKIVRGLTNELEAIKNRYLAQTAASSLRKQPFGCALFGDPGVGKSAVLEMLYDYDCKIRGRDPSPQMKYQVPSSSDHFDNFRSWYHTIVLDDVGQHNPGKVQGIDPSIEMLIKIANNQGFCPPQASLEDKGKTPVLVDLMFATTNVLDMNIPLFFSRSYAAMRRIHIHIQPIVKPQYCKPGSTSIDPTKTHNEPYGDFWVFRVRIPKNKGNMAGEFVEINYGLDQHGGRKRNFSLSELLQFWKQLSDAHSKQQDQFMTTMKQTSNVELHSCGLPQSLCECVETQSSVDYCDVVDEVIGSSVQSATVSDYLITDWRRYWPIQLHATRRALYMTERDVATFCDRASQVMVKIYGKADAALIRQFAKEELPILYVFRLNHKEQLLDFANYCAWTRVNGPRQVLQSCQRYVDNILFDNSLFDIVFRACIYLYLNFFWFQWLVHRCVSIPVIGAYIDSRVIRALSFRERTRRFLQTSATMVDTALGGNKPYVKNALKCLAFLSSAAVVYKLFRHLQPVAKRRNSVVGDLSDDESLQLGVFPKPHKESTKANPWVAPERTVTSLDFCPQRMTEMDPFLRRLSHNVLPFHYYACDGGGNYLLSGYLFALTNDKFLTNSHSLINQPIQMKVFFGAQNDQGVADSVSFVIQPSQVFRVPERDVAIIHTKALPARFKDLTKNFVRRSFTGRFGGFYYKKNIDGSMSKLIVDGVHKEPYSSLDEDHKFFFEAMCGSLRIPTEKGDCGLPLVVSTGFGPAIVGIHHALRVMSSQSVAAPICYEDLEEWKAVDMDAEVGALDLTQEELTTKSKSYVDYHPEGCLVYHGELKGFRVRPKHSVFKTQISNQLFGRSIQGHVITDRLTGPVMDNWRPQQVSLTEFVKPVNKMDETIIQRCIKVFKDHIVTNLDKGEHALLHVYPYEVAVNGAPGIKFVDPIKKSTSMGHPYRKPKRNFLEPLEDDRFPEGVKFTPEVEDRINRMIQRYEEKKRSHPIFSGNLKDEPVSFKKWLNCKTRVFFSCPADFLIVVRMFFMAFCRVVMRNPFLFKVAVGLNPHSSDWQDIWDYLSQNPVQNCVAGDHVFYDKRMQLLLSRWVMTMVVDIMEMLGNYSQKDIEMCRVIIHDMVNPSVDYFGMIMQLLGGEVSGHQMTTIFNCLCNIIYLMYCYYVIIGQVEDFFEHVLPIVLGDDNVFTVSDQRKAFNHTSVQKAMKDIGLDYTMANKEDKSVPFIHLSEATFLKRSFTKSPEFPLVVGPLDVESIFKMITFGVKSKAVSKEEQLAAAMCSARAEAFYHGKKFFTEFCTMLSELQITQELEVEIARYPPLSWDEHMKRFLGSCSSYTATDPGLNQKDQTCGSYCGPEIIVPQSGLRMGRSFFTPARALPEIRIYGRYKLEANTEHKCHQVKTPPDIGNYCLANQINQQEYSTGSMSKPETDGTSEDTVQQQTTFANEPQSEVLDMSQPFDSISRSLKTIAELGDFLKRPTFIFQHRWTENAPAGVQTGFDPWALYFNTAAIKNKLQGFHLLRANLVLKFMVNGSPFYYGKLGAMYRPLPQISQNISGPPTRLQQIIASQRPHVWLDNQATSNAEMILPFLYPYPFLDTSLLANLTNMGRVELWQYAQLRSANGVTTTGIDITVYAYAEDFELGGQTGRPILQSKKEYVHNGTISGPASTVAGIARRLKDVPVIGNMASATEAAAGMVGGIASLFGFTNVPVISDVEPIKPIPFQLASSTISEPVMKLSLQPKQEIAVGSAQDGGSQIDELHLSSLLQRESFLTGALWSTGASTNDNLFVALVAPFYFDYDLTTACYAHTPLSYFSNMFDYWRGSIVFKFKVVRSQYHRGRLNISWDVGGKVYTDAANIGDPSCMNVVLDLDETDEVEVEIPYTQAKPFLDCAFARTLTPSTATIWNNTNSPSTFMGIEANGLISVKVMNRLTAPEASSDVDLLVFVRAGDDFSFAGPCDIRPDFSHSNLQTSVLQSSKVYVLGNKEQDVGIHKEVFGEEIVSLRELLHRSSLSFMSLGPVVSSTDGVISVNYPIKHYPRPPGVYNNGWNSCVITTNQRANFTRMHPLNWVLPCFIGYKGSVNVTINLGDTRWGYDVDNMNVVRMNKFFSSISSLRRPNTSLIDVSLGGSVIESNINSSMTGYGTDGVAGMALTNQRTNTGLCVNLPFYSKSKFYSTNPFVQYSNEDTFTDCNNDWYNFNYTIGNSGTATRDKYVTHQFFWSTGPDFDVVFFLNVPFVYLAPLVPTP